MNEHEERSAEVEAILDRVEQRVVAQVARDNDLLGPLDEAEIKARVKAMPSGIRGPMVFALAGLPSLRRRSPCPYRFPSSVPRQWAE